MFVAMSIVQGGCGVPFLADPVYDDIVQGKCRAVQVDHRDIPQHALKDTVQKVSRVLIVERVLL